MAFSIGCQACLAEFSLDEGLFERRVAGKKLRFKCPACGAAVGVDGSDRSALKTADASAGLQALEETQLLDESSEIDEIADDEVASLPPDSLPAIGRPPPRPKLESKLDDELWVVSVREGAEDQEIFESSLTDMLSDGKIPRDAIVWCEGMTDWLPLADVPRLAKHLPQAKPVRFGSSSGDRKSAPPPLPPKKRSHGSSSSKSHGGGQKAQGTKPIALSPGFLFSVDDAPSEPPDPFREESPKGTKAAPKPPLRAPRRAVTRDLDFSDIADDEEIPLSGTPALKDLTTKTGKGPGIRPASASRSSPQSLASLGGTEEEVLAPPSIDISDLDGSRQPAKPVAVQAAAPETQAEVEVPVDTPAAESVPPPSRSGKKKSKKHRKSGTSHAPAARSSTRPSARPRVSDAPRSRAPAADRRATAREAKSEKGAWLTPGRVVVLLGIVALAYFLFSRQLRAPEPGAAAADNKDVARASERPESPESPPSNNDTEESPPTAPAPEAPAEPAAEPKPAADAAGPVTKVRPAGPTPASPTQPDTPAPAQPKPAPAEPAPAAETPVKKPAAPAPASNEGAPPFDKAAAVSALSAAVAQASGCRQPGDPTGTAQVVLTFAPSGRVTSANLNGPPFAGTRTGGCIASTMRRAKVPPFSGAHVTVSKNVVIR